MANNQYFGNLPFDTLKLGSNNVRGINNKKKRRTLFRKFKQENFDIISIQESYIDKNEDFELIIMEQGGKILYNTGSAKTKVQKGLITFFHLKFNNMKIEMLYQTSRILISLIDIAGHCFLIVNVYAPREDGGKGLFLDNLNNAVTN